MMNVLMNTRAENASIKNMDDIASKNSTSLSSEDNGSEKVDKPFSKYLDSQEEASDNGKIVESKNADIKDSKEQESIHTTENTPDSKTDKLENTENGTKKFENPVTEEKKQEIQNGNEAIKILDDSNILDNDNNLQVDYFISTLQQSSNLDPTTNTTKLSTEELNQVKLNKNLAEESLIDPKITKEILTPVNDNMIVAENENFNEQKMKLDNQKIDGNIINNKNLIKGDVESIIQKVDNKIDLSQSVNTLNIKNISNNIKDGLDYFINKNVLVSSGNNFLNNNFELASMLNNSSNIPNNLQIFNNMVNLNQNMPLFNNNVMSIISLPTLFNSPNWNMDFSNQLVWMAQQGVQSAQIVLSPPELGSIIAKLDIQRQQVHLHLIVSDNNVQQSVYNTTQQLQSLFRDIDLNLANIQISQNNLMQQGGAEQHAFLNSNQSNSEAFKEEKNANYHVEPDKMAESPTASEGRVQRGLVDTYI